MYEDLPPWDRYSNYSYMDCMVSNDWIFNELPDPSLRTLSTVLGVAYSVLLVLMIFSVKMTWVKYKLITRRNTMEAYDKTYCLTSKWLVQIVALGTPVCLLVLAL